MATVDASLDILSLVFGKGNDVKERATMEATKPNFTPLLLMPKGSERKVWLLESLLSEMRHFDDLYLFYTEGLEAIVSGVGAMARDTKILIDRSHPLRIFLNTNDADKYEWVSKYIISRGIKLVNMFGKAEQWIPKIKPSTNRSLVFINGAFIKAQKPELVNFVKGLLPNSTIIMVVIDPYKSRASLNPKSIAHKYGHCMQDFLSMFHRECEYKAKFFSYGIKQYLAVVGSQE